MSFGKTLGHYPAQISRPFITYTKAEDEAFAFMLSLTCLKATFFFLFFH